MGFFVEDGHTLEATIEARPGLHPELKVTYRPATPEAVHRYYGQVARADDSYKVMVAFLLKHLVGWEAGDVPLTEANLRRLKYQLQSDLVSIITGYSVPKNGEVSEAEAGAKN